MTRSRKRIILSGKVRDLRKRRSCLGATEQGVLASRSRQCVIFRSSGRSPNALLLLPIPSRPRPARLKAFVARPTYPRGWLPRLHWRAHKNSPPRHGRSGGA